MTTLKVLAVFMFMAITSNVMAQNEKTDYREDFRLGLKAGLNYSNVYDEKGNDFNADPKFGFAGGAFASIPISKYVGIQPEILFSQKGFKGEGVILGSEYELTRTTTYLDIPLQIAFKPSEFLTIVAGPQYSYLLNQKDEFNSSAASYSQEQEFDNDNIRKNILGIVAGLDINIKKVVIGTRLGLDVRKNHGDGSSSTPRYKNMWFHATIGYSLIN